MKTSESCAEVVGAFIKAQHALKKAAKGSDNPFFDSKYADLGAVWDACQKALADNDLAAIQDVQTTADGVDVTTRIVQGSTEWIECGPLCVPLGKKDAHGVGAAITYGRRYGLSATLGVVSEEDDDANAATKKPSAAVATDSYKIVVKGYKNKEAAKRKWQNKFAELCEGAPDTETLNQIQEDNMDALERALQNGEYDPIQASIDQAHKRLAPLASV